MSLVPHLDFGREVCGHRPVAQRREWLVTNGIGGFAMGTVSGLLTRRYHGLLIAALQPPLGRTLLLSKLDETVRYGKLAYPLFANLWIDGTEEPVGYRFLERFHLEGTTPVWTFAVGDALLEKRIWLEPGANTTYISYHLARATLPLTITAKILINYRDYHATTCAGAWTMTIQKMVQGLKFEAFPGASPYQITARLADFVPHGEWYEGYFLPLEAYRGQEDISEAHFYAGTVEASLSPGERLTLVASTDSASDLDGEAAYDRRRFYEERLLSIAGMDNEPAAVAHLALAADQFIVRRAAPAEPDGRTIIAGYPWFSDWGRDTMIALPGLTLATGRFADAAKILRTFAHFIDRGMLPNRFPDLGEEPEYNTVDATLWYFEALRAYHTTTGDDALLRDLFPTLRQIIDWHRRGTRYNIQLDAADGLIRAGSPGVQLTWMDAKVGDWVVTPRMGKPVEISALWFNALCSMADFARLLGENQAEYRELMGQTRAGFGRFWNRETGYCFDVLDGPQGNDAAMRPNQLFAVALHHSPLDRSRQKAVVDACARQLLTSHGLRSLAAGHHDYVGHYGGDQRQRDAAYHQGSVWGWLIGPFASAHRRVYGDDEAARDFLRPLLGHLVDHGIGSISEIFDGDPPHTPRGCPAQAWSVAELLRVWRETAGLSRSD